jgi:hypothetical protein
VLVIDERGFGNGHCLPYGPLREPAIQLTRFDAWVNNGLQIAHPDGLRPLPRLSAPLSGGSRSATESHSYAADEFWPLRVSLSQSNSFNRFATWASRLKRFPLQTTTPNSPAVLSNNYN